MASNGITKDSAKTRCRSNHKINYWDIFREDATETQFEEKGTITDTIFRITKITVYILLFSIVFIGTIVSWGSLHILTNELYVDRSKSYTAKLATETTAYYLILTLTIPDCVRLMISTIRFILTTSKAPPLLSLLVMVVLECIQYLALSVSVFKIMPLLNAIEVCVYLSGIPLIPAIVNSISNMVSNVKGDNLYTTMMPILYTIKQVLIVLAVPIYKFSTGHMTIGYTFIMFLSSAGLSVRWFKYYFDYSISETDKNGSDILVCKTSKDTNTVSSITTSFSRLCLALVLYPTILAPDVHTSISKRDLLISSTTTEVPVNFTNYTLTSVALDTAALPTNTTEYIDSIPNNPHAWLMVPFLVHFFASEGLFYAAILATRLCIDKICFCVALAVGTPFYVLCVAVARLVHGDNWISKILMLNEDLKEADVYVMLVIFVVTWLIQLWICRHIWYTSHSPMTPVNRLFALPHYCSPIPDLSLLHSRRQDEQTPSNYDSIQQKEQCVTKVYICATMWHEERHEMKQCLKTIFRLDLDQAARRKARDDKFLGTLNKESINTEYYEIEAHIIFDDAMETTECMEGMTKTRKPNKFVEQLKEIIPEAVLEVYQFEVNLHSMEKILTPYGGRLVFTMPGENKLIVHLKDKEKARHKKRWSQVMYLYYLLGYQLVDRQMKEEQIKEVTNGKSIFDILPSSIVEQAENTYIMSIDGDVDFAPKALRLLLCSMKKNPEVGATCGRIKPGGSGHMVWYQKFEYALAHWLQKSAEHFFGCVLCCPGCFSLFRAKALMDDNIMKTYASLPTEPQHYLQYDQGEDRWLSTLILKQGYRIEYCASAEAVTFAPEGLEEFFIQRKRWIPSTLANIIDLLLGHKKKFRFNPHISYFFQFYQLVLFISGVLGPATVLLALQFAIRTELGFSPFISYVLAYGPPLFYIFVCFKFDSKTQLTIGNMFSLAYAMLMLSTIAGLILSIPKHGFFMPSTLFLCTVIIISIAAGLCHPYECSDLICGIFYFLCIPAGYLFLIVYAICNLHDISWGTREKEKAVLKHQNKKSLAVETDEKLRAASKQIMKDILNQANNIDNTISCTNLISSISRWINNMLILRSLESVQKMTDNQNKDTNSLSCVTVEQENDSMLENIDTHVETDDISWLGDNFKCLDSEEEMFWTELISNYLEPLHHNEETKRLVVESLKELRNKVAFAFFFINGLWLAIMTAMHEIKGSLVVHVPTLDGDSLVPIEPLGLLFLVMFICLLFLQFFGMANLRYETFLHLLASTNFGKQNSDPDSIIKRYTRLYRSDVKWNTRQQTTDRNQSGSTVRADAPSVVNLMDAVSFYESKPKNEDIMEDTPNQLVDKTTEISFRNGRQESNITQTMVHQSTWERIINPKHKLT